MEVWGYKIVTFIAHLKQLSLMTLIMCFINYSSLIKYDWRNNKFVLPWMGSKSWKKLQERKKV